MRARCQCGQISLTASDAEPAVVACHCIACQRRTGSPFGVLAYVPESAVTINRAGKRFERATDEGNTFESFFCQECGSTVYARSSKHPQFLGIAVGALADPEFPPPVRSVWEQTKHPWVIMPEGSQHVVKGRTA